MKKNLITVISSQGENNEMRLHINYENNVYYKGTPATDDDIYVNFHEYPAVNVMNEDELNNQVSELNANGFRSVSKSDYQRLMN